MRYSVTIATASHELHTIGRPSPQLCLNPFRCCSYVKNASLASHMRTCSALLAPSGQSSRADPLLHGMVRPVLLFRVGCILYCRVEWYAGQATLTIAGH